MSLNPNLPANQACWLIR